MFFDAQKYAQKGLKTGFFKYLFKTVRIVPQPSKFAPVLSNRNLLAPHFVAAPLAATGQTSRNIFRGLTALNCVLASVQSTPYVGR
jgi:hypothetical protein